MQNKKAKANILVVSIIQNVSEFTEMKFYKIKAQVIGKTIIETWHFLKIYTSKIIFKTRQM